MNQKIKKQIAVDLEILSTIPKNNEKNREIYLTKASSLLEKYKNHKMILLRKMNSKNEVTISKVLKNEKLGMMLEEVEKLKFKIKLLNKYTSSYEKLGFDRIFYSISKYYKGNLKTVNYDIFRAINLFKQAGITLTKEQFYYSNQAMNYMEELLKNTENPDCDVIEELFERLYWQNPNIITHIELNFRDLFHKHEKLFDTYIEKLKIELLATNESFSSVVNAYRHLKRTYDETLMNDVNTIFNKAVKKEISLKDYADDKVKKIYQGLVEHDDGNDYSDSVIKLHHTANEYKSYLRFNFLITSAKKFYDKPSDANSKNKIKEINKLEVELENISTKKGFFNRIKKSSINIEESIEKLKVLYKEYDQLVFKEKMMEHINPESKVIDLLGVVASNYVYLVNTYKEHDKELTDLEINKYYDELLEYILSPYHTIINNLYVFKDYNLEMIIGDKYKLNNLNITKEMLSDEELDNLINDTKIIIDHHIFMSLEGITLEEIEDYCRFNTILESQK